MKHLFKSVYALILLSMSAGLLAMNDDHQVHYPNYNNYQKEHLPLLDEYSDDLHNSKLAAHVPQQSIQESSDHANSENFIPTLFSKKQVLQSKQHLKALLHTFYKYEYNREKTSLFGHTGKEFKDAVTQYVQLLKRIRPEREESDILKWFMSLPIDDEGNTAAHVIALNHDTKWVTLLAEMHAKLNRKNKNGDTPFDVAHQRMFRSSSAPMKNVKRKKVRSKKRVKKQEDKLATSAIKGFRNVPLPIAEKWNIERFNKFSTVLLALITQQ